MLSDDLDKDIAQRQQVHGESATAELSKATADVLAAAERQAASLKDEYVSTEHLLLALAAGPEASRLKGYGLTAETILQALSAICGSQRVTSPDPRGTFQALETYGRDLTRLARRGKLDPVIGRDEEIRRTIQVLSRRTKNNPGLIGDPGVGKTAIVEGLAQRIVHGDVPEGLKGKRIVQLDLGARVAGAKYRGVLEERLQAVLKEVTDAAREVILFLDEMPTVVGAGAAEGAMDAGNMLKPMLARGTLHLIGATTVDEYRKCVEKDAALERRFQPVMIDEPTVEGTISILRGLKERYEVKHGVRIQDAAVIAAARLSQRYIADRHLPDKAIDLIDEAGARLRTEIDSKPQPLDEVDRQRMQLEIERQALKKEKDRSSVERRTHIESELANLRARSDQLHARWESEKQAIGEVCAFKEQIEQAERRAGLEAAARLRYGTLRDLETGRREAEQRLAGLRASGALLKEEVDAEDTWLPFSRAGPAFRSPPAGGRDGEADPHGGAAAGAGRGSGRGAAGRGQRRAPLTLRAAGSRPANRIVHLPRATGVGKTELARALAEFLFDDERAMVRIDRGEYLEKHTDSRLVGAPLGYVGYEDDGQLTEAVRGRPYSVVLLDEIEKAHPEVFNVLLWLLDDGRLTDGHGRAVGFRNTVVIMTSNLGGEQWGDPSSNESVSEGHVRDLLTRHLRPEFLNRIDEVIVFHRLTRDDLARIVEIQLDRVARRVEEAGLHLEVTPAARQHLADTGYGPVYGARPLKRTIRRLLQDRLALLLLQGEFCRGDSLRVDASGNGLTFTAPRDSQASPA
ncbi:MAG: ATP-dependent Clp protease ATP-binding subunit [Anaerolineales bacterium]|nr:ATP-dependent Clp protease ATP-binding subunit [Anaerolineales bacterium]